MKYDCFIYTLFIPRIVYLCNLLKPKLMNFIAKIIKKTAESDVILAKSIYLCTVFVKENIVLQIKH